MKIKYYTVTLLLGLLSTNLFAQGNNNAADIQKEIIPPSPDVASLGKFIEKPISLSNGSVNVSVPLEEIIVDKSFSIPVQLSYYMDGIKVNEEANHIGLGWNLSTTSFVNRQIRGTVDDLRENLNITINRVINGINSTPGSESYHWVEESISSGLDTEPDEYNVSLFGNNFKFYYDFESRQFISVPNNNFRIEGSISDTGRVYKFIITDDKGNKYFFGNDPINRSLIPNTLVLTNTVDSGSHSGSNQLEISSWYLDKIITSNNNEVVLEYTSHTSSSMYGNINLTEQFKYVNTTDNFDYDIFGAYAIKEQRGVDYVKVGSVYPISDQIINSGKTEKLLYSYTANHNNDLVLKKIKVNNVTRA